MNIACIACPARYAVPDGKIAGRKVRITCKRCSTPLIIDGTVSPPTVRGDGVRSQPPAARYLLALTEVDREEADPEQVARLYAGGKINAQTLAWKKGMGTWLTLFEIDDIAKALKAAGYSPPQAALPPVPRIGGDFEESEEEATRIVKSPLEEPEPERIQSPLADEEEEEEATQIFDTEGMKSLGWAEPASWSDQKRDRLIPGEWREHGALGDQKSTSQPPGAWTERGMEEDEVTRMVAPLEDQLQAMHAPISSRRALPPIPVLPPAPAPAAGRRLSSRPPPPPRRSSQPPSLPAQQEEASGPRLTGQRDETDVLFTLGERTLNQPPTSGERASLDMGGPSSSRPNAAPLGTLSADAALLAPPASPEAPKLKLLAPDIDAPVAEFEPPPKRRAGRFFLIFLLLVGAGLGAAYATGRWPLVVETALGVWQKVNPSAR